MRAAAAPGRRPASGPRCRYPPRYRAASPNPPPVFWNRARRAIRRLVHSRCALTCRLARPSFDQGRSSIRHRRWMARILCPPPFTAVSTPCERAKLTAFTTSAVLAGRAIKAGCRSNAPFQTRRAWSYPVSCASSSSPLKPARRSLMSAAVSVTCLPAKPIASMLAGTTPLDASAQSGEAGSAAAAAAAPPMKPRRLTWNLEPENANGGNADMSSPFNDRSGGCGRRLRRCTYAVVRSLPSPCSSRASRWP